jgi:hypothetical protein
MYKVTYRVDENKEGGLVLFKVFNTLNEAMEFSKSIAGRMLELKRLEDTV